MSTFDTEIGFIQNELNSYEQHYKDYAIVYRITAMFGFVDLDWPLSRYNTGILNDNTCSYLEIFLKRIPALKSLSMDHHLGLVLARKAKIAATQNISSDEQQVVWTELLAHANDVLLSHFDIEETYIATALSACGDPHLDQLVDRLYKEHASLRYLLSSDIRHDAANLQSIGELLEQHIRFEERELFEVAQTTLDDDTLQAIAAICDTRHNQ